MKGKKIYIHPETAALQPLSFDAEICDGCNRCVEVCQVDILVPHPTKKKPPVVVFPGECWYGGCCVAICPKPDAIRLNTPLMNRVHWKKKV
jgi:Na+-translocating ferredoxin:NAD+ oxidoreductase RNF subunit RnfB